ncbi:MAG: hypothetical protein R3E58_05685 [Phycisphaerae bacterium]
MHGMTIRGELLELLTTKLSPITTLGNEMRMFMSVNSIFAFPATMFASSPMASEKSGWSGPNFHASESRSRRDGNFL